MRCLGTDMMRVLYVEGCGLKEDEDRGMCGI
jgi:hypothetical protein